MFQDDASGTVVLDVTSRSLCYTLHNT